MRFVMGLPNVQVVLSGMNDLAQVRDNVKTFTERGELTEGERELVKRAAALLRPDVALPCTACQYCCPNCPAELDIPTLLVSYNDAKADASWRLVNLLGLPEEKRPSACIGCGNCTAHCLQSLPVPDAMREMAEMLNQF